MMTALPAAGCLTAVSFPVWRGARIGPGFAEVSARRSDFAFVAAASQIEVDDVGVCKRLVLGIGATTPSRSVSTPLPPRSPAGASRNRPPATRSPRRSPASSRWRTCTPPPATAAVLRKASRCASSWTR